MHFISNLVQWNKKEHLIPFKLSLPLFHGTVYLKGNTSYGISGKKIIERQEKQFDRNFFIRFINCIDLPLLQAEK
jgi:hypothetical protein